MKFFFTIVLATTVLSCAEPKYVSAPTEPVTQNNFQESAANCQWQFTKEKLCLQWKWVNNQPTLNQDSSLIFKIYRLNQYDQTPVETDPIGLPTVSLWMKSMGHGSSPTTVTRLDVGTFRADKLFFIMAGDWEIKFQLTQNGSLTDEIGFPIWITN